VIVIDDKEIVQKLNNRDEQALTDAETQYGALCKSVARNILGSDADAEECLNDGLLAVWNTIPPEQPRSFCAYLLRIVRNAALDRFKARQRGKRGSGQTEAALEELSELLPAADDVERQVEQQELLAAITRFLQTLPQKQRQLFVRRYWRFASYAELARDYGMREGNVQVTLTRLRKKLREYLREEGLL
jgi:RNA polymerase sigma-70 factor (ECF subfamily)